MDDLQPDLPPQGGLREHNRTERRARLREAARTVFCRRGYQDATTREIASLARVAHATLFRYARDKRELLLMIINDDLDDLAAQRWRAPPKAAGRGLREQIMELYRPRYEYFARYPLLSRPFVSEAFYFMGVRSSEVGPEARRNRARRGEVIAELQRMFEEAGRVPHGATAKECAELVHVIYLTANRIWLESATLDAGAGLKTLGQHLRLAANGFDPPRRPASRRRRASR
ncbi:MAG TPA: TetR/AcrR family transcriptional regulator [Alphaproteobacteria bacterium]|nr:TetR/AcrR family transcriptional regulator [Alphaproteobacteria bacterium]